MSPAARRTATRRKTSGTPHDGEGERARHDPQDRSPPHVGLRSPPQDDGTSIDQHGTSTSSNSHGTTLDTIEKQIKKLPANLRRGSASWLKTARKLAKDAEKAVSGGGRSAARQPARKHGSRKATTRKATARKATARKTARPPRNHDARRASPRRGSPAQHAQDHGAQVGTAARAHSAPAPRHAAARPAARRRAARPPRALGSTRPSPGARLPAPPALSGRRGIAYS